MKKYFILLSGIFCLPLWANALNFTEAEKSFEEGNFSVAEKQYEQLLANATGNDLLKTQLRLAACQYHQGKYLIAAQTIYNFPLPTDDVWKARFLLYRIHFLVHVDI